MPSLLIGATSSGCGKTTFTMGLLRALRNRGLHVQPFKSGPDYIDPLFHQMASGVESVNLDTYMSSVAHVQELFSHYGADADACIIEAAMGLFDGADGPRGSAAEVAQVLNIPVLLLVNAKAVAYSVAPLIYGFRHFNPHLQLAGVVFNFVASERQLATLQRACKDAGVPCFGYLPRNPELQIPSRHLGLTLDEREKTEHLINLAAKEVETHIDLDSLLQVYSETSIVNTQSGIHHSPLSIAVARDEAFNFIYRANIDALRTLGSVTFFSPLHDTALPPCDFLYLPGGYPELFAETLAANSSMRESVRAYAEADGHILAECGGFMYLCRNIDGLPMCNILPLCITMQDARLHLGYRKMSWNGHLIKGHEFHYSSVRETSLPSTVLRHRGQLNAAGESVPTSIYEYKKVRAGYSHWYWADDPQKFFDLMT